MANNVTGVDEIVRQLKRVGKAPAKVLTTATKKGANIIRSQAKSDAPKNTGALKRSIKIKSEKRKTGKKVYQIKFIGDNLAKVSKSGKRSFYPVSQEYGWTDKNGKRHLGDGKKFLRNALSNNRNLVQEVLISEIQRGLGEIVR